MEVRRARECSKSKVPSVSTVIEPAMGSLKEALESMTGTVTTTPQIKNLIGRASENKRAARAARTYEQVSAILCKNNNVKLPHLQF